MNKNLLFSFVYFPIFKGLFLQLQSMFLSFHARFMLTIYHFYFLIIQTMTVKFLFFLCCFLLFFLTWVRRAFCRTRAVLGKLFYFSLFYFLLFFLTWARRAFC